VPQAAQGIVRPGETELQMTERHVRTGNRCVLRQRELVRSMDEHDASLGQAKRLLDLMERLQHLHLRHHRRLHLAEEQRRFSSPAQHL
jgi:hypothetical protein